MYVHNYVQFFNLCNCYLLRGHKPFLKSLVLFLFFSCPTNCHFFKSLAPGSCPFSYKVQLKWQHPKRERDGGRGDCGYQHKQMGSPCIHCKETETPFRNRRLRQSQGRWQGQENKKREFKSSCSSVSYHYAGAWVCCTVKVRMHNPFFV